jgi:hypothetical protein
MYIIIVLYSLHSAIESHTDLQVIHVHMTDILLFLLLVGMYKGIGNRCTISSVLTDL